MQAESQFSISNVSPLRLCAIFGLLLLLILVCAYWPFIAGAADFFVGDHAIFFQPFTHYIRQRLLAGQFPLWNPYAGLGESQIANLSPGLLYPPNMLFVVLPYSKAMACLMIFHQWLAGMAGLLLIRRIGWGWPSALLFGTIAAFNGYMFSSNSNYTLGATAAWVLVCLLAVFCLRNARTGGAQAAFCLGVAASVYMMLTSGRPEVFAPGMVLCLGAALVPGGKQDVRRPQDAGGARSEARTPRWNVRAVAALICGVLLSAPALLPAWQWAQLSPRAGFAERSPFDWSASWYDLLSVFVAQPFGDCFTIYNRLNPLIDPQPSALPFLASSFVGTGVAALAVLGLLDKTWRLRFWTLGFLAVALMAAAGKNCFVFPALLKLVPVLALLRYPVKLMIFSDWALALLAARGLSFVLEGERKPLVLRLKWLVVAAAVLTGAGIVLLVFPAAPFLFALSAFFGSYVAPPAVTTAIRALGAAIAVWCALATAYLACLGFAVVAGRSWLHTGKTAVISVSILFVGASLVWYGAAFTHPAAEPGFYKRPSFAADAVAHVVRSPLLPRTVTLTAPPLYFPRDYHLPGKRLDYVDYYQYYRQLLLYNTGMDFDTPCLSAYAGTKTRQSAMLETRLAQGFNSDKLARVCRMTATPFAVMQSSGTVPPLDRSSFLLVADQPQLNIRVYQVRDALPPAYFITGWQIISGEEELLAQVFDGKFDPARVGLLSAPLPFDVQAKPTGAALVKVVRQEPEHWQLSLDADSPGLCVVANHCYPGWHATVDGAEQPILRCNLLLQAVPVLAAGHHVIELRYRAGSFVLGLETAALGALLLALLAFGCVLQLKLKR